MDAVIELKATDGAFSVRLPLRRKRADYGQSRTVDIVYQWAEYSEFEVRGVVQGKIDKVKLYFNDVLIWFERPEGRREFEVRTDTRTGESVLRMRPANQNRRPFQNIFGFTDVVLILIMESGEVLRWYSRMLAVAVEKDQDQHSASLCQMLRHIYDKDRNLLVRHRRKHGSNLDFAALARECVETLSQALPYFVNCPRTEVHFQRRLEPLEKLHTVTGNTLAFVVSHPEYLIPSCGTMGISFGHRQLLPDRVLVNSAVPTRETYENRTIVEFINLLTSMVQMRLQDLEQEEDGIEVTFKGRLHPKYTFSHIILGEFLGTVQKERRRELRELEVALWNLRGAYSRALLPSDELLQEMPYATQVFTQVPHYASVFSAITSWFAVYEKGVSSRERETEVHFASADGIYEQYCLTVLQEIIEDAGYTEDESLRTRFEYDHPKRFDNYRGDNTFSYANAESGCQLTLYYQPCIFVNAEEDQCNGISLVRVDSGFPKACYTPDFLLKRTDAQGTVYGIIDAKWRNRGNILPLALAESVNKYLNCIVDRTTFRAVPFLWLLQGKDEGGKDPAYHRFASTLCRKAPAPPWLYDSVGVVRLTPDSGTSEWGAILRAFLAPGNFLPDSVRTGSLEDETNVSLDELVVQTDEADSLDKLPASAEELPALSEEFFDSAEELPALSEELCDSAIF